MNVFPEQKMFAKFSCENLLQTWLRKNNCNQFWFHRISGISRKILRRGLSQGHDHRDFSFEDSQKKLALLRDLSELVANSPGPVAWEKTEEVKLGLDIVRIRRPPGKFPDSRLLYFLDGWKARHHPIAVPHKF